MDTLALAITRLNTDVAGQYRWISAAEVTCRPPSCTIDWGTAGRPDKTLTLDSVSYAAESASVAAIANRNGSLTAYTGRILYSHATARVNGAVSTGTWSAESYTDDRPWLGQLAVASAFSTTNLTGSLYESIWHDEQGYRSLFDPASFGAWLMNPKPWTGQAWNRDTLWLVYGTAPGAGDLFVRVR